MDKKDKQILHQLDIDASQSGSRIAKKVGLNKDSVNYRIRHLEKKKIINYYYTVLNTPRLGFLHFNTMFRFRNINERVRKKFVLFCKEHERVIWCVVCYGNWDFSVSFLARDISEYQDFIKEILNNFGNSIHEKAMSMITDSPTYSKEYLVNGKGNEFKYQTGEIIQIDKTEHKLLSKLSQNARMPIVDLAKELNLTTDIVRHRISKLERLGIIEGVRASINTEKLGFSYYKILFTLNNLTVEKEIELKEFCKINSNIVQFTKYLGPWEIQIEAEIEAEKIYELIEELRNRFSDILKTYEILRLKQEKLDYYPLK